MEKPIPPFHKRIIKKKSSSAEQRKTKHKKSTKAELKKEFLNHCRKVIEHIQIFNRISMVNEKITHLNTTITHLKECLTHRPGNHLLRNQMKICRNELVVLKETGKRSADNIVEILFTADLF
jgi:vacuolar-type H+-ATPase subunit E/Vma4|tara:strand:+ start:253 stop:618 length:366 start_codon:yes stop_codon:yes gene_type:complete